MINYHDGMTLIELVSVLAIIAILVMTALPTYHTFMLRVHRGEAVRMLLQTAMCQERIHARMGHYDTGLCASGNEQKRYKLSYQAKDSREQSFTVIAIPKGAQKSDHCGSLSLDQSGFRQISATNKNVTECWNGR